MWVLCYSPAPPLNFGACYWGQESSCRSFHCRLHVTILPPRLSSKPRAKRHQLIQWRPHQLMALSIFNFSLCKQKTGPKLAVFAKHSSIVDVGDLCFACSSLPKEGRPSYPAGFPFSWPKTEISLWLTRTVAVNEIMWFAGFSNPVNHPFSARDTFVWFDFTPVPH